MNTHLINQLISNLKFDRAFQIVDKFVFVNLDWLTNRDYQSQGVSELIYTAGYYVDKVFVFLIRDGVNCKLTGLDYVIKSIIDNLNLNQETCFIYSYEDLNIPNSTYIKLDVIQMWCSLIHKQLPDYDIQPVSYTKKFAALFGRHDIYRLKISKELKEKYSDQILLSYNSNRAVWNSRFKTEFQDDEMWFESNCPILLDFEKSSNWVPYQDSLTNIIKHLGSYFIEIVSETDVHSNKFFTEKSLKNFYFGKPFILMSGHHSLKTLHNYGFKTFSPWIDESYDNIVCPNKRLAAILEQVRELNNLSFEQLTKINQQMTSIFEHNKQNFLKFV